jgi:transcriptional regulator with XRE-family HTH domain
MSQPPSLGAIVRKIRKDRAWTLAELSKASGIPLSTLSKIENDKLTLTYDRLLGFCQSLGISLAELLVETESEDRGDAVTGRRSLARVEDAIRIVTTNYIYNYVCTDLRQRRMIPIIVEVTARSLAEFGALVRHDGEEFALVLEGAVTFHSDFYEPVTLAKGEGVYVDSNMGHAYVIADGFASATVVTICASDEEDLQQRLMAEAALREVA